MATNQELGPVYYTPQYYEVPLGEYPRVNSKIEEELWYRQREGWEWSDYNGGELAALAEFAVRFAHNGGLTDTKPVWQKVDEMEAAARQRLAALEAAGDGIPLELEHWQDTVQEFGAIRARHSSFSPRITQERPRDRGQGNIPHTSRPAQTPHDRKALRRYL